jgi:hypothetical protein
MDELHINWGRCDHPTYDRTYESNRFCDRSARFTVGDRRYCLQHANKVKLETPAVRVVDLPSVDEPTEPCIRCGDPTFKSRPKLLDRTVCRNCSEPLENLSVQRRLEAKAIQGHLASEEVELAFDIWEALYRFQFKMLPGPEARRPRLEFFVSEARRLIAAQKEEWREETARRKRALQLETALDNEVEVRVERLKAMGNPPSDTIERFALREILRDERPEFGHRTKVDWGAIQAAARWRLGEAGRTFPGDAPTER